MIGALQLDQAATLWVNQHYNPVLDVLLVGVSYLGDYGIAWGLAAIAMLIFGNRRTRLLATIFLSGLLLTEFVLMPAICRWWDRPRPFIDMAAIRTLGPRHPYPSFPSAHAHLWGQAVVLFAVAFPRLRWPLIVLGVLTLYSRPYMGNHYVLDSLAGAVLGVGIGALDLAVASRLGLLRAPPEAEATGDEPVAGEVPG